MCPVVYVSFPIIRTYLVHFFGPGLVLGISGCSYIYVCVIKKQS